MIFMRLLLLLFFFTVCLNAESLYFPFQKEAFLTSSFGENRGTRYHAGVDYSTNMEEGWVVFALNKKAEKDFAKAREIHYFSILFSR